MFCNPMPETLARVSCGLSALMGGDSRYLIEEDEEEAVVPSEQRQAPVSWLVAKAPKALQRPIVFNQRGFEAFRLLETRSSDVLVTSYPRCGLSWAHALAYCLLGKDDFPLPIYCETRSSSKNYAEKVASQPEPRLLCTHARPGNWPRVLEAGGRVVVVVRDPRDALVSTFFRLRELAAELKGYEALDERIGACAKTCAEETMETVFDDFNDDGSKESILSLLIDDHFDDFQDEEVLSSPKLKNARFYGDFYTWHLEMASVAEKYGRENVHLIFYEDLQDDPDTEATKLAMFLKMPANEELIADSVDFASFETAKERGDNSLRKGVQGDHRIYLTPEHWDAVCRKTLLEFHGSPLLRPLCDRIARDCPSALHVLPKQRRRPFIKPQVENVDQDITLRQSKSERPSSLPLASPPKTDITPSSKSSTIRSRITSLRRSTPKTHAATSS